MYKDFMGLSGWVKLLRYNSPYKVTRRLLVAGGWRLRAKTMKMTIFCKMTVFPWVEFRYGATLHHPLNVVCRFLRKTAILNEKTKIIVVRKYAIFGPFFGECVHVCVCVCAWTDGTARTGGQDGRTGRTALPVLMPHWLCTQVSK